MIYIPPEAPPYLFPPLEWADENGLLAIGGDLSPARLIAAYERGIFPWYGKEDIDILWWSPDPRMVLYPSELHISRSLKKEIRRQRFEIRFDTDFIGVIRGCAAPRKGNASTWLLPEMQQAYIELHRLGYAHSIEAWQEDQLVGGLYGMVLGGIFYGESMFSRVSNASKVAFVHAVQRLAHQGCHLIDCQVASKYLAQFGARNISRSQFIKELQSALNKPNCL